MKHTPGPWQCAVDTPGIRPTTRGVIAPRCENMLLATVYNPAGRIKEREANARLIAAAPELLEALKNVPDEKRGTRFVSVIALFDPVSGKVTTCRAEVRGRITREPRGERPFGYDPIFFYDEAGKTGGEMSLAEKDTYSHRGRALTKAREILVADFT